jgi:hypothetical protein
MAEISEYISTQEASARFGLSQTQIQLLLRRQSLQGRKIARDWLVNVPSLEYYLANRPRPGLKLGQKITRPRKAAHA